MRLKVELQKEAKQSYNPRVAEKKYVVKKDATQTSDDAKNVYVVH